MSNMNNKFGKVGVLMGGLSLEREISLQSGNFMYDALIAEGVNAIKIDWNKDINIIDQIKDLAPDCIVIALHGTGGEDGEIQAVLNILDIPYTGTGLKGSSIMMDKVFNKSLLQANGLLTPPFMLLEEGFDKEDVVKRLGLPLVVKPISDGSSFGISMVKSIDELTDAWDFAHKCGSGVFVEKFIFGTQLSIGILDSVALPCIKIETPNEFYDFDAKYEANSTQYICPAGLSAATEKYVQQEVLRAFKLCDGAGWGRVDGMLDDDGSFHIFDMNTVPGMTPTSLVPKAAKVYGIERGELMIKILETAGTDSTRRDAK